MSISVSQVTKFYGAQAALKNISFEIRRGEVVGFLGPNGAGKSTMMKILTAYLPASLGNVEVCGYNVNKNSVELRRIVGYLPEHNPLYPDMYIGEFLEFIASVFNIKKSKNRVNEMIKLTGLEPERHKKIGSLSKGYRQRVGLAQALLPDPDVLILDEPTSGLDPNQIIGMRKLIEDLGRSKTILLSTHIMQEVKAICERVIIINKGEKVVDEQAENLTNLYDSGDTVVVAEFEKQPDVAVFKKIDGVLSAEMVGNQWFLRVASDKDIRAEIFKLAVKENLILLGLNRQQQSLEEVFQSLTTK